MKLLIKIFWLFIILLAFVIGIYPFLFLFLDMSAGLLGSKDPELMQSTVWNFSFYTHIYMGGVALLIGWIQFLRKIRSNYPKVHRNLGAIYVLSVFFSGLSGAYIALYATGDWITKLGFFSLALAWIFSTANAYLSVRYKDFQKHEHWMIRSYALTFAAVSLRILLPLFQGVFEMDFLNAYRLISWCCWIPNLLIAELLILSVKKQLDK